MDQQGANSINGKPYPKRERFFAQRFLRLLAKTCAAQEIGVDAAWLLTVIATLEDAARYKRGITFFNEQLMPILGFTRWHRLDAARKAAVNANWLHYEAPPSGKRRTPGRYWVTIPADAAKLPDGSFDEGEASTESVDARVAASPKASTESVDGGVDGGVDAGVEPSYPLPGPSPLEGLDGKTYDSQKGERRKGKRQTGKARYVDVGWVNLSDAASIVKAHQAFVAAGLTADTHDARRQTFLAAIRAREKANDGDKPAGLFVTLARNGPGDWPWLDDEHAQAKAMIATLPTSAPLPESDSLVQAMTGSTPPADRTQRSSEPSPDPEEARAALLRQLQEAAA